MRQMSSTRQFPVVTIAFIALSVLASLTSALGSGVPTPLLMNDPGAPFFASVAGGEVWRLVTPMFVHFSILHILFNMMWLWDLGRAIELRKGAFFLGLLVVATGTASNLAQYFITQSPLFGGMSGVVYALLGYFWIQGRINPNFGMALHQTTVIMMLVWYVVCWTGLVGPIANWAHTAGLLMGLAWGLLAGRSR